MCVKVGYCLLFCYVLVVVLSVPVLYSCNGIIVFVALILFILVLCIVY